MNRLEEIRQRAEKATPGPWEIKKQEDYYGQGYGETTFFVDISGELLKIGTAPNQDEFQKMLYDTLFIAHAREDIPWLLERIGQLEKQLAAAVSQLESFAGCQACKSAIDAETCSDKSCMYGEKWVWRGPKED